MPSNDPRIDAYIEKSADFAKPILEHLRKLVHKACPEVEETWKWSVPHFTYKGMLCHMAAFKAHASFGFWKQSLLETDAFPAEKTAMGSFGKIASLKDLPPDILARTPTESAGRERRSADGVLIAPSAVRTAAT